MICVMNISKLREIIKENDKRTILLMGSKDLNESEKIEIAKVLGSKNLASYQAWVETRGTFPYWFFSQGNMVYVSPLDKDGEYDSGELGDAITAILGNEPTTNFVTKNDLLVLGLPGKTPFEREKARADLTRWFSPTNVTAKMTILCHESD